MTTRRINNNKWRLNRIDDYFYLVNDEEYREDAKIYNNREGFVLAIYSTRGNLILQKEDFTTFEDAAKYYDQYKKEIA